LPIQEIEFEKFENHYISVGKTEESKKIQVANVDAHLLQACASFI